MKRFALALVALLPAASAAVAQSSPNWSYGYTPTAGEYRAAFASKQDLLNFTPLSLAGGTMRGKLNTAAATINGSGFSILPGVAPTSPANGDMWITSAGFFIRVNNQTVTFINQSAIVITGGTINGTSIGQTTPAAGAFSTLTATTPVAITSGGTGATTASAARSSLGAAGSGSNTDITSLNAPSLGAATATTPSAGDNSTRVATTAALTTAISAVAGAYAGQITGFLPTAIPTGSTVTISAGAASDSTNAAMIIGGPLSWAAANGNAANGFQGGTALPASSTIHFFAIKGTSGVASFASTSLSPTLPTGYASYYRRIFSLNTNGSGALIGVAPVEIAGGAIRFWIKAQAIDVSTAVGTTATSLTLPVPTGVKVEAAIRDWSTSATSAYLLFSGDETVTATGGGAAAVPSAAPGVTASNTNTSLLIAGSTPSAVYTTNTSGQIGAVAASPSTNITIVTRGFVDFRRN